MTMTAERFLTLDQIATELQVNSETVRRWLKSGQLRGTLLSRQAGWRIERAELERFIASRQPGEPPTA